MTTHRAIVDALSTAAARGESVVLATVVQITGSSYGGVGTRMVVHVDGSTVGLVSGGCLESDLAEHAREVHATGNANVVTYDTRADDDAAWGLGLGCNGLIDVLLEPLSPDDARRTSALLERALSANTPSVVATVVQVVSPVEHFPSVGAHALFASGRTETTGNWGDGAALASARANVEDALAAGRGGFVREYDRTRVAFEVVMPSVRLVICGAGPDVIPLVRFATQLGWDVTVVDHRPVVDQHAARFPDACVVDCPDAHRLSDAVSLTPRTAAVVMSHHFARDAAYVQSLLSAGVAYVGVLGPRARTERMLADLAASDQVRTENSSTLFGPVGLDVGGDGPDAIALAIIAEVSAVTSGRGGGHLRDRNAPLHSSQSTVDAAAGI